MGDWGAFFQSPLYIFLFITFVYTYKNNPPFPPKIPESIESAHFFMGDFLENAPKKAPKKPPPGAKIPHRAKKYPARLVEPYGAGLVFISTNILLRGLYLRFQLKGLEI